MRCPKCHYLSFDPEPRCKNCGYDLEVADTDLALRNAESAESAADQDDAMPDLPLRERATVGAPITLELVAEVEAPVSRAAARLMLAEEEEVADEPDHADEVEVAVATAPRPVPFRAPHTTTSELPLFVMGG